MTVPVYVLGRACGFTRSVGREASAERSGNTSAFFEHETKHSAKISVNHFISDFFLERSALVDLPPGDTCSCWFGFRRPNEVCLLQEHDVIEPQLHREHRNLFVSLAQIGR